MTCNKQEYLLYIACRVRIDCLSIALDMYMLSHNGYGPGTQAQGPKAVGPGHGGLQLSGPGPGPISIMAEHMCIKGNQSAINMQAIGNI